MEACMPDSTAAIAGAFDANVLLSVLARVRGGDFTARMPLDWKGAAGEIAEGLNDVIVANQALEVELARVSHAVGKQGDLSQRVVLGESIQGWSAITESVNSLIEALVGPTNEMQRVIDAVAGGELDKRAPADVGGPKVGRLLLAEDNLINQKVEVAMLTSAGYRVDTVLNGAEAVKAVANEPYDAILMDCQMPEVDGYEATAAIRALNSSGRLTPIIAVTAGAGEEDRERCLTGGMDDYLSKPVNKDALLALVARSIKDGPAAVPSMPRAGDSIESEAAINLTIIGELRLLGEETEQDLLGELVGQFVHDAEPLLVQIRAAMEVGDAPAVGRIAHSLKGSAVDLGGLHLASVCSRLERLATAGRLSEGEAELQEMEISCQEFCRTLIHELSSVDRQPSRGTST
jgi:CheY-like chemotaxis protein